MQFPVPQFTDVEDRIIAGLSFKQFGIVLVAAVITFAVYSISKSILITIVVGILTGLPALALVFGRLNGRPLYASAGNFVKYLFGPKMYVYHKQALSLNDESAKEATVHIEAAPRDNRATALKIKELNYILQRHESEESVLLERIKDNKLNTQT